MRPSGSKGSRASSSSARKVCEPKDGLGSARKFTSRAMTSLSRLTSFELFFQPYPTVVYNHPPQPPQDLPPRPPQDLPPRPPQEHLCGHIRTSSEPPARTSLQDLLRSNHVDASGPLSTSSGAPTSNHQDLSRTSPGAPRGLL